MESPINPQVPQLLLQASLGAFSAAMLFSVYHQRYRMLKSINPLFSSVQSAQNEMERVSRLSEILSRLKEDAASKRGDSRLSADQHGKELLALTVLNPDGSNAETVTAAAGLLSRIFAQSPEGKREMARLKAPKVLVKSLSLAHSAGLHSVLESLSGVLRELTTFDEEKVVLQGDVPEGAECAYQMAIHPSTPNILAVLDPATPPSFLSAIVTVLTNVCMLHRGAVNLSKGCHGHSGMSFFMRLLDHRNLAVSGKAVEAVAYLCRANCGREELTEVENLQRLASNFSASSEKLVIHKVLTIVMIMANDKKYGPAFFDLLPQTSLIRTMFDIWVSHADAETRKRAEVVACLCLQVASTSKHTMEFLNTYRRLIVERSQKDEQEEQRRMQQMQQQQFMQQMMMMQQM